MQTNTLVRTTEKTHEGAPAKRITHLLRLRRSVLACMLWERSFYEEGMSIAERIVSLVAEVEPKKVAALAIEARSKMKLRHVPLLIVREMARLPKHKGLVANTLENIIQRPDEMTEFLSLYWLGGKETLSAQVKKGLARAFVKFSAYQLAKYDRKGAIKLRDVLFLTHAKPKDKKQAKVWKQLIDGTLSPPDTWEVALSTGKDKKQTWERLLDDQSLGALALLRNLRNMFDVGVQEDAVFKALENIKVECVLPFRFISAAKYAPQWEGQIEMAMLRCLEGRSLLRGKTVLLVDISGSMHNTISDNSNLMRFDVANGLAILARGLCEDVAIYSFSQEIVRIPDRHGFALRDAISNSQRHGSTYLGKAVKHINNSEIYDRIVVLTDEQSHDAVPNPKSKGYMINVAAYKNGVGYGSEWTHIDGWSEAIFDYIVETDDL